MCVCVVCFCVSAVLRLFVMCLIIHVRRGWGTTLWQEEEEEEEDKNEEDADELGE